MIDPCLSGNRFCSASVIAGDHVDRDPHFFERGDCLLRGLLHLICNGDDADDLFLICEDHCCLSLALERYEFCIYLSKRQIDLCHKCAIAERIESTFQYSFDTVPGNGAK